MTGVGHKCSAVARLTFPREGGGKPLLTEQDKTVSLECLTYKATFRVNVKPDSHDDERQACLGIDFVTEGFG